ncbi:DegQ family serine endoprotease [Nitratireductor kimnyeongensis]|uniref:DegQ family serine endoprotease n=1 Tax=Nitratireductor kimnyeongensis TaxID=430679 RepID=A0ABW0T3M2_9HYPH|nr:DegQ family serine endoprotease [Nitratireductor kimnyeongensis]QZZ35026.1 DegQ family serine endoprotease [Nitratireductor kimnyeongensis]
MHHDAGNKASEKGIVGGTKGRLMATIASVAIAGAIGLGAVTSGTAPVMAEAVRLDQPVQAPSFADIVEKVSPAVVSVRVKADVEMTSNRGNPGLFDMPGFEELPDGHPLKRFFREFRGDRGFEQERRSERRRPRPVSQGSGFFISEDGYLVTNNHVVDGGSNFTVVMDDGTEIDAKLIGTDPRTDLAVLKVEEERKFTYVDFADDEKVRVGDWVVAVGNPFGLGGTVTAGIVSARGRDIGAGPYDDFIQIDAAVNRGNSGGPAFNLSGEVVGINTAIFSPSGGNVGIAFAIPASVAKQVVGDLIEDGTVERGWLGVQIQPVSKDIAESVGLDEEKGALVADAQEGEPAAKAGIRSGDIIIAVDEKPVASPKELARLIAGFAPGNEVDVTVWRDGETENVKVTLSEMPGVETMASARDNTPSATVDAQFGLKVTPAEDGDGLVVTDVEPDSPADDRGIRPGDIIRAVNSQKVKTGKDVENAVAAAVKAGRKAVLVQIERDEASRFVALPTSEG